MPPTLGGIEASKGAGGACKAASSILERLLLFDDPFLRRWVSERLDIIQYYTLMSVTTRGALIHFFLCIAPKISPQILLLDNSIR